MTSLKFLLLMMEINDLLSINKNKQVDFYNFNITNKGINELIRTGWTDEDVPRQTLSVPILYIDGDTYIENTRFGTIESTPAGLGNTGIIVTPVGEGAKTRFKVYGSGNIETNGTIGYIDAVEQLVDASIISYNTTNNRWEINSKEIILAGDTISGGTY